MLCGVTMKQPKSESDQTSTGHIDRLRHQSDSEAEQHPLTLKADQLAYMADLVLELKHMAERAGLDTLSSILALAQLECTEQAKRCRR